MWVLLIDDADGAVRMLDTFHCKKLAEAKRDHYALMMGWDNIQLKKIPCH